MIRLMALDEIVGNNQDRMTDSHNGFLLADAPSQAMILSRQVGAFGAGRGMSGLVEQDTQRSVAAPRLARRDPSPGGQVTGRFKAAHVEANLRDNALGDETTHTGNSIDEG